MKRRLVETGYCVRSDHPNEQTIEVLRRFNLAGHLRPWSRCLRCNGLLEQVDKAEILDRLEPRTQLYYDRFTRCRECGRIYWEGSHTPVLRQLLRDLGIEESSGETPP